MRDEKIRIRALKDHHPETVIAFKLLGHCDKLLIESRRHHINAWVIDGDEAPPDQHREALEHLESLPVDDTTSPRPAAKATSPPPPASATAMTPGPARSGTATPPRMSPADVGRQHREPTAEEADEFTSLQAISIWSRMKGRVDIPSTMAGSLLSGLGFDEDSGIVEVGSLDVCTFTAFVRTQWAYSTDEDAASSAPLNIRPKEAVILRALAFHNACRLHAGFTTGAKALAEEASSKQAYRTQKLQALQQQADAAALASTMAAAAPQPIIRVEPALATNTVHVSEVANPASTATVQIMEMPDS